jgi:predicted phosphodiesterase
LLLSAVDTYRISKEFYVEATRIASGLQLRRPTEGETVAVLVSDRHDNIGMDPVTRAIAEQAGATVILDAGDDTSTGAEWETFSLDSLQREFRDFDRYAVSGNHDHGSFVRSWLADRGWVTAEGEPVDGPGGSRLLAVDDPRSSGLGNWRDVHGLTVDELAVRIADAACAAEERVNTLLVHDSDMGTEALRRGCVDLVLSGHLHTQIGPDRVTAPGGETGYAYTNGTTGGAAYAIAVGSKLRRPAEVTLVTYRDGRPVGLQPVTIQTTGTFTVSPWLPLSYP